VEIQDFGPLRKRNSIGEPGVLDLEPEKLQTARL